MASTDEAPPRPLTLAFLGCGRATAMHSRTLSAVDAGVRRVYASRDGARATEYSRRFGGVRAHSGYAAAIGDDEVSAVLIATPPNTHLELTLAALRAGKDVIVEKPPFLGCADFDAAHTVAAEHRRQVHVAENYFYKPLVVRLRALLSDGAIGEPRLVLLNAVKSQRTADWRDDERVAGGGALFEGGIHWISLLANMGMPLTRVTGHRAGGAGGLDRSMLVVAEYAGGAVGSLAFSWEIPSPLGGVRMSRIFGTEGAIAFESNGLFVAVSGRTRRLMLPGLRDLLGYRAMFRDILGAIRERRAARYSPDIARRDLELVEMAYASLREGNLTSAR